MSVQPSGVNVFISYGRQDAAAFVDKLANDLKNAGLTVWRDTDELRSAHPWDEQLAAALKRCDAVIAVLTPHAVRTGREPTSDGSDSVCLDELAFARFSPPPTPIIPLLLMPCEPPFVIFRLNYLDFLQAGADEVRYKTAFEDLLTAIRAVKAGDAPPYRSTSFEPLDFDNYLRSKTRDFVGRGWLITEVFERLTAPDASPALLLVGDPGWGKTAFAAHLFTANPGGQLLAAHFCRTDRSDSIDPRRFVENLVAMTAMRVPVFEAHIGSSGEKHVELLRRSPPKDALEQLLLEPLAALDPSTLGELPRYILVDGLDETATAAASPSIDALLAQTIALFPDWLRLIGTSRDKTGVLDAFGNAGILRLDRHDARNQRDIQTLIKRLLEPAAARGADGDTTALSDSAPARLTEIIDAKSEGNALCAVQLALAARRSGMDATSIATLPRGLTALYRTILRRRFDPDGSAWTIVREVLEMIVATRAPLPVDLAAIARGDRAQYETRKAIESISDLLSAHDDRLRLFHQTLAEFLGSPSTPFFANPTQGAARLAGCTLDGVQRAELPLPLRTFCIQQLRSWLLQCDRPGQYAGSLTLFFDEAIFSRPAGPVSYYVNGVTIDVEDERLIASLIAADQSEVVLDIIALAFLRAENRFRHSGAVPWIRDGHSPRPDLPLRGRIAAELEQFFGIISLALGWTRALARALPDLKPRLRQLLAGQGDAYWALGWLDIGVGCHTLGLSGYFEDQAAAIRADWAEIKLALAEEP